MAEPAVGDEGVIRQIVGVAMRESVGKGVKIFAQELEAGVAPDVASRGSVHQVLQLGTVASPVSRLLR